MFEGKGKGDLGRERNARDARGGEGGGEGEGGREGNACKEAIMSFWYMQNKTYSHVFTGLYWLKSNEGDLH